MRSQLNFDPDEWKRVLIRMLKDFRPSLPLDSQVALIHQVTADFQGTESVMREEGSWKPQRQVNSFPLAVQALKS